MAGELEIIFENLRERLGASPNPLIPPYIYLDNDICRYFFQEFTGLSEPPPFRLVDLFPESINYQTSLIDPNHLSPPALHLIFNAMFPLIKNAVPFIDNPDDLNRSVHRFIRIQGLMQSTHFPDGNLNIEVLFGDVRGLLFHTPEYFNTLTKPVMAQDSFFDFNSPVEVLAYLHGPLQKMIFYHQTYGDNKEYDWVPLVPVSIRTVIHGETDAQ